MNLYLPLASGVAALAFTLAAPVVALAAPDATPKTAPQTAKNVDVRYVVMLGGHDFAGLAAAEKAIIDDYRKGLISTDEFSVRLIGLVSPFSTSYIPDAELWVKAQPKSYAARLGLGRLYLHAALEARGKKYASETSREQFANMRALLQKAEENLLASILLFEKPYSSYINLINVDALRLQTRMRHYLDQAIKVDPAARLAYQRYIQYRIPRWGGSYEELDALLAEIEKGPMLPQDQADIEARVLSFKAMDEATNNPTGAIDLYIQAYERLPIQGEVIRLYWAAGVAKENKQTERALKIYTRIIDAYPDEHKALFERGYLYGQMLNYELALKDYIASAKLGNKYAQNNAGYYYMVGRGGVKDLALAKSYLSQSAGQGFEHAKEKLKVLEDMMAEGAK
jgi:TPR repeat protein